MLLLHADTQTLTRYLLSDSHQHPFLWPIGPDYHKPEVSGLKQFTVRAHTAVSCDRYQHLTPRKQEKRFSRNTDVLECGGRSM